VFRTAYKIIKLNRSLNDFETDLELQTQNGSDIGCSLHSGISFANILDHISGEMHKYLMSALVLSKPKLALILDESTSLKQGVGAAVMLGWKPGVAQLLLDVFPRVIIWHCAALELSVVREELKVLFPRYFPDQMDMMHGDAKVKNLCKRFHIESQSVLRAYREFKETEGKMMPEEIKPLMAAVNSVPISSAECKRGYSQLNLTVTPTRTALSNHLPFRFGKVIFKLHFHPVKQHFYK
ncbi:K1586 ligase, partial [Polyodon spathula]|nr:K1586 ligase [Polyodon spathula]